MAPIRSIFASRTVVVSLAALGCLAFFLAFSGPEGARSSLDRFSQEHFQAKPLTGLGLYPGRKQPTTTSILAKSEGYYKRILNQRAAWLTEWHFGTPDFNPWAVLMYWWWYFPAPFACPHDIQRVGPLSDGGKWLCGMSLYEEEPRPKCVMYSFGINHETRFEGEMLDRTDCEIWAYDASVTGLGPDVDGRKNIYFKPYFIGRTDHVDGNGVQWKTLRTLMNENGHDWIDILKVDIEGAEYQTFDSIMEDFGDVLPFSQLQLELHVHETHIKFPEFLTWWEKLESKGIRPWWTELNLNPALMGSLPWASEYCFINTRGGAKNLLIQDY